ncbi:hypothetical protein AMTR_s00003p00240060 [Amborella trichopoda]|uniref:Uncharacterized protein n=1 Tax=Amborella trichopoda TaxID=13333 RepID=W1P5Z2_AMBTC|nr:hypothetical protein AMTR_s00003p00240060 [Amborella trichopoda]
MAAEGTEEEVEERERERKGAVRELQREAKRGGYAVGEKQNGSLQGELSDSSDECWGGRRVTLIELPGGVPSHIEHTATLGRVINIHHPRLENGIAESLEVMGDCWEQLAPMETESESPSGTRWRLSTGLPLCTGTDWPSGPEDGYGEVETHGVECA